MTFIELLTTDIIVDVFKVLSLSTNVWKTKLS